MKTNDKRCHFIIIIQKGIILFIKCVFLEKRNGLVPRCLVIVVDSFQNKRSLSLKSGHGRIVRYIWQP